MDLETEYRRMQYSHQVTANELAKALVEIERLREELAAAESTIMALEDPELRAALTEPTIDDYGPVPPPHDVR